MQFTADPVFGRVEDTYQAYLEAWGTWMVGHHAGAHGGTDEQLAQVLIASRGNLSAHLRALGSRALALRHACQVQGAAKRRRERPAALHTSR